MSNPLRLWKGYNNGIVIGSVVELDEDGDESAFDLTAATITLELYERDGTVAASFTGSIVDAASGTYSAKPDADDLDDLTPGAEYYWRTKIVNATYPQGRLFAEDTDGNLQQAIIMGNSSGT